MSSRQELSVAGSTFRLPYLVIMRFLLCRVAHAPGGASNYPHGKCRPKTRQDNCRWPTPTPVCVVEEGITRSCCDHQCSCDQTDTGPVRFVAHTCGFCLTVRVTDRRWEFGHVPAVTPGALPANGQTARLSGSSVHSMVKLFHCRTPHATAMLEPTVKEMPQKPARLVSVSGLAM